MTFTKTREKLQIVFPFELYYQHFISNSTVEMLLKYNGVSNK